MLTLYRLSQRRLPALIALMAILMLFIAPEVSKTLEHRQVRAAYETSSAVMGEMDMGMMPMDHGMKHPVTSASPDEMTGHAGNPVAHGKRSDEGIMDDFACGYCQLLVHSPLLAWVLAALILLLFLITRVAPSLLSPAPPMTFFPGISQPRAPPAV
ncbi:DUF2946 domain-containing protein [Erwinia endophytica]|uniref:DUF2946 domain-containing protein n=1 Tax=Erwinia endophytica TaxID=1563158 RepID=UPI001F0456F4|nr:DUF2946 domain-containing protein [Erwinia endophytica]